MWWGGRRLGELARSNRRSVRDHPVSVEQDNGQSKVGETAAAGGGFAVRSATWTRGGLRLAGVVAARHVFLP